MILERCYGYAESVILRWQKTTHKRRKTVSHISHPHFVSYILMTRQFLCSLPLYIELWRKKKRYYLNLNNYRNWHHHVSNKLKKKYKAMVTDAFHVSSLDTPCSLLFVYYAPTRAKRDISNVCAIHDKFFSDALVDLWVIPDDNTDYITSVTYEFGGICREYARVDIFIY